MKSFLRQVVFGFFSNGRLFGGDMVAPQRSSSTVVSNSCLENPVPGLGQPNPEGESGKTHLPAQHTFQHQRRGRARAARGDHKAHQANRGATSSPDAWPWGACQGRSWLGNLHRWRKWGCCHVAGASQPGLSRWRDVNDTGAGDGEAGGIPVAPACVKLPGMSLGAGTAPPAP